MASMSDRSFRILLVLILLFSFGTRFISADHGLPEVSVGDENSDLTNALRLTQGELMDRQKQLVRALIAYTNLAAVGGLFGYSVATGAVESVDDFEGLYFSQRWQFTLATRWLLAILTTAAIGLVALCGRYLSNTVGIFAALFLALSNFFTLNSLFALPDALVAFTTALVMWLTLRLWKHQRRLDYVLMGLGFALLFLAKLQALPVGMGFLIAHYAVTHQRVKGRVLPTLRAFFLDWNLWLAALSFLAGLVLFNPFWLFVPDSIAWGVGRLVPYAFSEGATARNRFIEMGNNLVGVIGGAWQSLIILTIVGIAAMRRFREQTPYWIFLASFLALFIILINVTTFFYKVFFWMPWMIPMALVSGAGAALLLDVGRRGGLYRLAYAVIVLVLFIQSYFLTDLLLTYNRLDTRQLAAQYAENQWDENTAIMTGDTFVYSVPFERTRESIERAHDLWGYTIPSWEWRLNHPESVQRTAFNVYGPEMQVIFDTFDDVNETLQDEQIEYFVIADLCQDFWMEPDSNTILEFPPFTDAMLAAWEEIAVFSPFDTDECLAPIDDRTGLVSFDFHHRQVRPGPIIRIYRLTIN